MTTTVETMEDIIEQLTDDLRHAAQSLTVDEARFLVDSYYEIQEFRKATANQHRALASAGEPGIVARWLEANMRHMEGRIKAALDHYSDGQVVGRWAKSIMGIGPVISAGLLAHIDITKAPTVGHIWRFAGLDPTVTWEKGQKRPWNARLKVLCWKTGESFVKVSGSPKDVYGKIYVARKTLETERNVRGDYADQAKATLAAKKIGKETEAYKAYTIGRLPPARIHLRAQRYAVKLFLAHLHHVMYEVAYGVPPPRPYVIEHLGHANYLAPPNWPME